mgnify:CR=1 FL=1
MAPHGWTSPLAQALPLVREGPGVEVRGSAYCPAAGSREASDTSQGGLTEAFSDSIVAVASSSAFFARASSRRRTASASSCAARSSCARSRCWVLVVVRPRIATADTTATPALWRLAGPLGVLLATRVMTEAPALVKAGEDGAAWLHRVRCPCTHPIPSSALSEACLAYL